MNQSKYKEDLKDIKDIMNRSSKFISLSGLSGIFAGIVALISAYAAYKAIYADQGYLDYSKAVVTHSTILRMFLIASLTLLFSIGGGILFTIRKARKNNQKIWDIQAIRLITNLAIPLVTGGILCIMFLLKGYIGLVAPLTLIFYGLALVNASKYTLTEIRSLGIIEIILGIIAFQYIGYGLIFWALGFGVLHIIYGILMHFKYDR